MTTNVLLVVVDNLRPVLGSWDVPGVVTPHMDGLVHDGVTFSRAFCQIAWCAPSRNSWLTGLRPSITRAYNFLDHFRTSQPSAVTLPGLFKAAGFHTLSFGKVFHPDLPPNFDFPASWSEMPQMPLKPDCAGLQMTCELPDDTTTADMATTSLALDALKDLSSLSPDRRFFIAVGLQSPRLSWSYPRAAAARLPPASSLPIAAHLSAPAERAQLEWFRPTEVDRYTGINATHDAPLDEAAQRQLRFAYYATIAHCDKMVGLLLDGLGR